MTDPQWKPEELAEGDPKAVQQPYGAAYRQPDQPHPMEPTDSFGQVPNGYPAPPSYPVTPYGLSLPSYARWGQRAKASLLDIFLPMFAVSLVLNIFWPVDPTVGGSTLLYNLAGWTLLGFIHGFTSGNTGRSWGRSWAGTKLVGEDGKPIGFGKTVAHYTLHAFDSMFLLIGFLWPLWDPKRQTLISDKALKTYVVIDKPEHPFPPAAPYQPR